MKIKVSLTLLLSLIILSSCVRYSKSKKNNDAEDSISKYRELYANYKGAYVNPKDTVDFSKIEISTDTIDLALFNMVMEYESYSESKLIENIEILINKEANPNAVIEYQYSVRKVGTYIPIIKHFYNNKYRTHTANSTAFHEAVNSGKINVVKKFIELKADINAPSRSGVYPVDLAVSKDYKLILKLLKENACDFSVADLSLSKNIEIIEWLVSEGADSKTIDINFAIEDTESLKRVLKLKPNLSDQELNYATVFNNEDILDILLEAGLGNDVRGRFPDECPPVYGAIKYGDVNTIKKLKKAGININAKCKHGSSETPLIYIVKLQNKDMLEYYLNIEKSDPNQKDWTKRSALIFAVNTDNDEIINMLINAGANIEYAGYFKKTPLMYAVDSDHYISAQALIESGANVNFSNTYGETPIILAVKEKNFPMIKLLAENGAKTKKLYKGLTLSQYAKSVEAPLMIIQYLEKIEK